jgi:hypothetical protein
MLNLALMPHFWQTPVVRCGFSECSKFSTSGWSYKTQKYIIMSNFKTINQISLNSREGRLLMAALAKITTESQTDKTPDEVLAQVYDLQKEMFKNELDVFSFEEATDKLNIFEKDLSALINKHSLENNANCPDFILAQHLSLIHI